MRTLSAALAALTLGLAGTAMAQEAVSPSSSATAGLSRAEVLADLEMWHQAGMTYLPSPSADRDISYNSAEYQRLVEIRSPHAVGDLVIIEGYDGPQP